jgi:hypothetical protein
MKLKETLATFALLSTLTYDVRGQGTVSSLIYTNNPLSLMKPNKHGISPVILGENFSSTSSNFPDNSFPSQFLAICETELTPNSPMPISLILTVVAIQMDISTFY